MPLRGWGRPSHCLLTCFRTTHRLGAAAFLRVTTQGSVELDAVAVGGDIGPAAGLTEDADGSVVPGNIGVGRLAARGRDGIGDGCFGRQYDGPEVLPRRIGIGDQAVFVSAVAHGCG